jgi:anti-sigma factor (TIGR02949 family)
MDTSRATNCDDIERLLAPYVDGEAEAADRAAVTRHLEACPPCRAHAQAEQAAREVLRARRPALAVAPPPGLRERCLATARRPSSALRWVPLSMAATLVLAVAGAVLYGITFRTEALAASIAADHLKCFKLVDMAASADPQAVAREWERSRGWRLKVMPDAPGERIRFVGIRRCLSTEGMVAHLMYTSEGRPLSVFVWPKPDVAGRDIEVLGQKAVIWSSVDRMYAVVGTEPADRMARVAAYMRQGTE